MTRRAPAVVSIVIALAAVCSPRVFAQDQSFTRDIQARARIFPAVGPGITAIKRDTAGHYYLLATPASAIQIFSGDGKRLGQIPNANSGSAKIVYASDMDLDAEGHIFVADRGSNAVKIFNADGSLLASVQVAAPISIAALSGLDFAATILHSHELVSVFNAHMAGGRSFGEVPPSAGDDASSLASRGRIYGDGKDRIYFAFTDLPDPTIRRYDRFGAASYDISLPAAEFKPPSESRQWTTLTLSKSAAPPKPVITALATDSESDDVWAAIGNELLHFDKDGNRRAAYFMFTKENARIDASAILIEHDRILIGDDPNGIFEFALPEPRPTTVAAH
jgi:hypothetical protein